MSTNLYAGVNPHLNSFLQSEGWEAFHASFIDRLTGEIDSLLPSNYYTVSEKSLQISAEYTQTEPPTGDRPKRTIPDVSVYRTEISSTALSSPSAATPVMTFPITDVLVEEETLTGVVIYRIRESELPGQPVTRLEVLSPANKPHGMHHATYLVKRTQSLKSGLRLVEIDLLHETPPVIRVIPSYADHERGAYPYTILISDPRPSLEEGQTQVFGTHVGEPLPVLNVPLDFADFIAVDFNRVYNLTFESRRLFGLVVDYSKTPPRFHTYSEDDQRRIQARMDEIAQRE